MSTKFKPEQQITGDHNESRGNAQGRASTVSDLIRSAERFIASGKFSLATDQLTNAQLLDPDNMYIPAILARIQVLQQANHSGRPGLQDANDPQNTRYLSVTVGNEFQNGIRGPLEDRQSPPKDLQTRIRALTNVAENFLENGLCKNAFDSLMKAYLLDPMSPYVIACEKSILPAWERLRKSANNT
jgi:hypothetical protein